MKFRYNKLSLFIITITLLYYGEGLHVLTTFGTKMGKWQSWQTSRRYSRTNVWEPLLRRHEFYWQNQNIFMKLFSFLFFLPIILTSFGRSLWWSSGQFHQCVYAQLLRSQIPKAQIAAWPDCLFFAFGTCAGKSST